MKNNVKGKLVISIFALLAVVSTIAFFVLKDKPLKTNELFEVKQKDVYNSIITSGSVISQKSVLIKSELIGSIVLSELKEGDLVTKDQTIALFNDTELSSSLKQAEISLLNAKNQLEIIKSKDIKDTGEQLNQAKYEYEITSSEYERAKELLDKGIPLNDADENLFRAKQNYEKAVSDFATSEKLFEQKSISRAEYDSYKMSMDISLSNLRSAENLKKNEYKDDELKNLKYKRDIAHSRLKTSQTAYDSYLEGGVLYEKTVLNVKQAEEELRKAVEAFNKTIIKAPFEGVIVKKNFNEGDNILAGQDLFYISDAKNIFIKASIDQKYLGDVKEGQDVLIGIESNKEESIKGRLQRISPAVDDQNGTVELTISMDSVPEYIKLNMTVNIEIITDNDNSVLVIDKMFYDETNKLVSKVENKRIKIVPIEVKEIQKDKVFVSKGLIEGDILVKPGVFKDGESVNTEK